MFKDGMRPVHPGEILLEEYLVPLDMSPHALAKALHLSPSRINEIVRFERGVTEDTALRLARYFQTTPEFWLDLQMRYNLKVTSGKVMSTIERDIEPNAETIAAMEEARRGELKSFDTVEELMADLNAPD